MKETELQQMINDLQQKIECLDNIISYNMDTYYKKPVYQPSLGVFVPTKQEKQYAWQIAVNASYLKGEYLKKIKKLKEALQEGQETAESNEQSER